jgi:hypothetical protein
VVPQVRVVKEGLGGSAQESNLPGTAELPHNGFEDRGRHQPAKRFQGWQV